MSATEGQRRPSVYRGTCFDVRHKTARRCWMGKHAKMPKSLTLAAVWEHMEDKEGKEGQASRRAFWLEVVTMQCYSRYCLQYPFWVKLSDCESLHMAAHFARFEALAAYYTCTAPWQMVSQKMATNLHLELFFDENA